MPQQTASLLRFELNRKAVAIPPAWIVGEAIERSWGGNRIYLKPEMVVMSQLGTLDDKYFDELRGTFSLPIASANGQFSFGVIYPRKPVLEVRIALPESIRLKTASSLIASELDRIATEISALSPAQYENELARRKNVIAMRAKEQAGEPGPHIDTKKIAREMYADADEKACQSLIDAWEAVKLALLLNTPIPPTGTFADFQEWKSYALSVIHLRYPHVTPQQADDVTEDVLEELYRLCIQSGQISAYGGGEVVQTAKTRTAATYAIVGIGALLIGALMWPYLSARL